MVWIMYSPTRGNKEAFNLKFREGKRKTVVIFREFIYVKNNR